MSLLLWIFLLAVWVAWAYPFAFRAPHAQKRESIIARRPTLIGLALEVLGIAICTWIRLPESVPRSPVRLAVAAVCGIAAPVLSWSAVAHLGRQFRLTAGLYHDHELVTTGPYAIVRHPIYSSLLALLLCTAALLTRLWWIPAALLLFIAGTEIRVQTEDGLLKSRFGERFTRYRKSVWAYVPFVR
jgi:protein-S-isoprenylcysteine O-methyltransferase Ste14